MAAGTLAGSLAPRGPATGKLLASHSSNSLIFPLSSRSPFNCIHAVGLFARAVASGKNEWTHFSLQCSLGQRRGWGSTLPYTIISKLSNSADMKEAP